MILKKTGQKTGAGAAGWGNIFRIKGVRQESSAGDSGPDWPQEEAGGNSKLSLATNFLPDERQSSETESFKERGDGVLSRREAGSRAKEKSSGSRGQFPVVANEATLNKDGSGGNPGSFREIAIEKIPFQEIKKIEKLILVTAHRRESFGRRMEDICRAILRIVDSEKEAEVIFPVHLNPAVRRVVFRHLLGRPRIHLVEPLDYVTFVHLMGQARLILTDSGGIQEEAPSLGVPVVVMRETTERPEAIRAGVAWLSGTDPDRITRLALRLLKKVESGEFRRGLRRRNPFGDGRAGQRISLLLKRGTHSRGTLPGLGKSKLI
ncbi:MAG: UDP-N-acetylglucosamine 2-epimerase [Candidatus Saccharicenans sp.]|nr:UDP-N-acetylglucosamine 2-epimerase [Candidatus Saccharicenans sp.]